MTWIETQGTLQRELRTRNFRESFALVTALVGPAEALGHHPDVTFGWGFVRINLTTHDAGGVTELDRQLALQLDEALAKAISDCHEDVTKPL